MTILFTFLVFSILGLFTAALAGKGLRSTYIDKKVQKIFQNGGFTIMNIEAAEPKASVLQQPTIIFDFGGSFFSNVVKKITYYGTDRTTHVVYLDVKFLFIFPISSKLYKHDWSQIVMLPLNHS